MYYSCFVINVALRSRNACRIRVHAYIFLTNKAASGNFPNVTNKGIFNNILEKHSFLNNIIIPVISTRA